MQADPVWSVHGHERNVFAWCRKGDGPVAHLLAASVTVKTLGTNVAFVHATCNESIWHSRVGGRDMPFVYIFKASTLSAVAVGEGKGPRLSAVRWRRRPVSARRSL